MDYNPIIVIVFEGWYLAKSEHNFITVANKDFKVSTINDEIRKAEAFVSKRYDELHKAFPHRFKKGKKKRAKGESIEQEVLQLLISITIDYLEEKQKIEDLKKEMRIKIDSLINRVELLL